jgi:hypothetical protein
MEVIRKFLKKLQIELLYDPAVLLFGICLRNVRPYSRYTCTARFIAALCTTVELWRQPRCPSTDG